MFEGRSSHFLAFLGVRLRRAVRRRFGATAGIYTSPPRDLLRFQGIVSASAPFVPRKIRTKVDVSGRHG